MTRADTHGVTAGGAAAACSRGGGAGSEDRREGSVAARHVVSEGTVTVCVVRAVRAECQRGCG